MADGRVLAIVPAKAESQRLPGKNLRPFAGKPLVAHTIENAVAASRVTAVYVSTDSEEIAAVARQYGAEVPFLRPPELAEPHVHATQPMVDLIERSGALERFDYVMMLLPTCPLRTSAQIEAVAALSTERQTNVLSVTEMRRTPYHFRLLDENLALSPLIADTPRNFQHGDAKDVYALNGACYCAPIGKFVEQRSYHYGSPLGFAMDEISGLDIDTLEQFQLAELFYRFRQDGDERSAGAAL